MPKPIIPKHDFQSSANAAKVDVGLKSQLIKCLDSDALIEVNSSDFIATTCGLVDLALREARKLYAKDPDRLVCVISESKKSNAYAIWGSTRCDWIVLTEGLLIELRNSANEAGRRFSEMSPETLQTPLGKRIQSLTPLSGGFQTALGSLLYVAAIGFFIGHEAGHHLNGHDGYYVNGVHAEVVSDQELGTDKDALIKQALEFQADQYGVLISSRIMMSFILESIDAKDYSEHEKQQYSRTIAALLSTGVLMALVKIRPQAIDWVAIENSTHPPAALRVIAISAHLSVTIKQNFGSLNETARKWIRLMSLELAAQGAIKSKSKEERVFQECVIRKEPAALRAVGIRAALHDPTVPIYLEKIRQSLKAVKPCLLKKKRSA